MSLEVAHSNVVGQLYAVVSMQENKNKIGRKTIWILTLQVAVSLSSIFLIIAVYYIAT